MKEHTTMRKSGKRWDNRAFTLIELLLVIGLMGILMGVGTVGAAQMLKSGRQVSLDKLAETLYITAQRNLTAAKLSGKTLDASKFTDSVPLERLRNQIKLEEEEDGAQQLKTVLKTVEKTESVYRVYHDASNGGFPIIDKDLFPVKTTSRTVTAVSEELHGGNWIITIDPSSYSVLEVYFSQNESQQNDYFQKLTKKNQAEQDEELAKLTVASYRMKEGGLIGYYGGEGTDEQFLSPKIDINIEGAQEGVPTNPGGSPTGDDIPYKDNEDGTVTVTKPDSPDKTKTKITEENDPMKEKNIGHKLYCWIGYDNKSDEPILNTEKLVTRLNCWVPDTTGFTFAGVPVDVIYHLRVAGVSSHKTANFSVKMSPFGVYTSINDQNIFTNFVEGVVCQRAQRTTDDGTTVNGWYYSYPVVLDSLTDEESARLDKDKPFHKRFPDFIPGEEIMLAFDVDLEEKDKENLTDEQAEGKEWRWKVHMPGWNEYPISNSLFADPDTYTKEPNINDNVCKAYIAYGRHLQNLDSAISGVNVGTVRAEQQQDIDFKGYQDVERYERWDYDNAYQGRTFTPVTNANLTEYDGKDHTIKNLRVDLNNKTGIGDNDAGRQDKGAGLFGTVSGNMTLKNLTLTDPVMIADSTENVGGMIGQATQDVTISSAQLYMTEDSYGGKKLNDVVNQWLSGGAHVGGLIGYAAGNVTMNNAGTDSVPSFAATVVSANAVSGDAYAGGLAGYVGGTLDVNGAWADCYIKAQAQNSNQAGYIGGLAGYCGADSTFENCYAAGFAVSNIRGNAEALQNKDNNAVADYLKTTEQQIIAAGFAPCTVANVTNAYSIFNFDDPTLGITGAEGKGQPAVLKMLHKYGMFQSVTNVTNAHYAYGGTVEHGTVPVIGHDVLKNKNMGTGFAGSVNPDNSKLYDLADGGLEEMERPYSYPVLTNQTAHYNDYLVTNPMERVSVTLTNPATLDSARRDAMRTDLNNVGDDTSKQDEVYKNYLSYTVNPAPTPENSPVETLSESDTRQVIQTDTPSRRTNGERFVGWYTEEEFKNYREQISGINVGVHPVQYWDGSSAVDALADKLTDLSSNVKLLVTGTGYDAMTNRKLYAVYERQTPFNITVENRYYNAARMNAALVTLIRQEATRNPLLANIAVKFYRIDADGQYVLDSDGNKIVDELTYNDATKNNFKAAYLISDYTKEKKSLLETNDTLLRMVTGNIQVEISQTENGDNNKIVFHTDTWNDKEAAKDTGETQTLQEMIYAAFQSSHLSQPVTVPIDTTAPEYDPAVLQGKVLEPFSIDIVKSTHEQNEGKPETEKLAISKASFCARFDTNGKFLAFVPITSVTSLPKDYQNYTDTIELGEIALAQDKASTYTALYTNIPLSLDVTVTFGSTAKDDVTPKEGTTWSELTDLKAALSAAQTALNSEGETVVQMKGALGESILNRADQITFEGFTLDESHTTNYVVLADAEQKVHLYYNRNRNNLSYDFNGGTYRNAEGRSVSFRATNDYYYSDENTNEDRNSGGVFYGQNISPETDGGSYYLPAGGESGSTKNILSRQGYDFTGWDFYSSDQLAEDKNASPLAVIASGKIKTYFYDNDGYLVTDKDKTNRATLTYDGQPCYVKLVDETENEFQLYNTDGTPVTLTNNGTTTDVTITDTEAGKTFDGTVSKTYYKHTYQYKKRKDLENETDKDLILNPDNDYLYKQTDYYGYYSPYNVKVYLDDNNHDCSIIYKDGEFQYEYTTGNWWDLETNYRKISDLSSYSLTPYDKEEPVTIRLTGGPLSQYKQEVTIPPYLANSEGYLMSDIGNVNQKTGTITPGLLILDANKNPIPLSSINFDKDHVPSVTVYKQVLSYDGETITPVETTLDKAIVRMRDLKMPDFDTLAKAKWQIKETLPVKLEIYIQRETDDWRLNTSAETYTNISSDDTKGVALGESAVNTDAYQSNNVKRTYDYYKTYEVDGEATIDSEGYASVTINGENVSTKGISLDDLMSKFYNAKDSNKFSSDKYLNSSTGEMTCAQMYLNAKYSNVETVKILPAGEAVFYLYFDRNVITFMFSEGTTHQTWNGLYEEPFKNNTSGESAWRLWNCDNQWTVYALNGSRTGSDSYITNNLTVLDAFYFVDWQKTASAASKPGLYFNKGDSYGHSPNNLYYWREADNNARDTALETLVLREDFANKTDEDINNWVKKDLYEKQDEKFYLKNENFWKRDNNGTTFSVGDSTCLVGKLNTNFSLNEKMTGYHIVAAKGSDSKMGSVSLTSESESGTVNGVSGKYVYYNKDGKHTVSGGADITVYNARNWNRLEFKDIEYKDTSGNQFDKLQDAYFYNAIVKRLPKIVNVKPEGDTVPGDYYTNYLPFNYGDEYKFKGWYTGSNGTGKLVQLDSATDITVTQNGVQHTWQTGTLYAYEVDPVTHEKLKNEDDTYKREEYKMGNAPLRLFAYWAPDSVTVSFNLNYPVSADALVDTGSLTTPESQSVTLGKSIDLPDLNDATIQTKYMVSVLDENGNAVMKPYVNEAGDNTYVFYKWDGWYTLPTDKDLTSENIKVYGHKVGANDVVVKAETLYGNWKPVKGMTDYYIRCYLEDAETVVIHGYKTIGDGGVMSPPLAQDAETDPANAEKYQQLTGYYPVSDLVPFTITPGYEFTFRYVKGDQWKYRVRDKVTFTNADNGEITLTVRNDALTTMAASEYFPTALSGYNLKSRYVWEVALTDGTVADTTLNPNGAKNIDDGDPLSNPGDGNGYLIEFNYANRDSVVNLSDVGYMNGNDPLTPLRRGAGVPSLFEGKDGGTTYYLQLTLTYTPKGEGTAYTVTQRAGTEVSIANGDATASTIASGTYDVTATLKLIRKDDESVWGTWESEKAVQVTVA